MHLRYRDGEVAYLEAEIQFAWSKAELTEKLTYNAHEVIVLAPDDEACYIEERKEAADQKKSGSFLCRGNKIRHLTDKDRCRMQSKKDNERQWIVASYPIFIAKQIIFMRCWRRRDLRSMVTDSDTRHRGSGMRQRKARADMGFEVLQQADLPCKTKESSIRLRSKVLAARKKRKDMLVY